MLINPLLEVVLNKWVLLDEVVFRPRWRVAGEQQFAGAFQFLESSRDLKFWVLLVETRLYSVSQHIWSIQRTDTNIWAIVSNCDLHEARSLFVKRDDLTSCWVIVCIWQHPYLPAPQMWKQSSWLFLKLSPPPPPTLFLFVPFNSWSHFYASWISNAYLWSVLMKAACPDSVTDSTTSLPSLPLSLLQPTALISPARLRPDCWHGGGGELPSHKSPLFCPAALHWVQ